MTAGAGGVRRRHGGSGLAHVRNLPKASVLSASACGVSAPAWRGADVVDVPGRPPGPGAVGQEVPEAVALYGLAARLAEDLDFVAPVGVPDDLRPAVGGAAQRQGVRRDDAPVEAVVLWLLLPRCCSGPGCRRRGCRRSGLAVAAGSGSSCSGPGCRRCRCRLPPSPLQSSPATAGVARAVTAEGAMAAAAARGAVTWRDGSAGTWGVPPCGSEVRS